MALGLFICHFSETTLFWSIRNFSTVRHYVLVWSIRISNARKAVVICSSYIASDANYLLPLFNATRSPVVLEFLYTSRHTIHTPDTDDAPLDWFLFSFSSSEDDMFVFSIFFFVRCSLFYIHALNVSVIKTSGTERSKKGVVVRRGTANRYTDLVCACVLAQKGLMEIG